MHITLVDFALVGLGGSADTAKAAGGCSQTETSALTDQQHGMSAKGFEDNGDWQSVMEDEERKGNALKANYQNM